MSLNAEMIIESCKGEGLNRVPKCSLVGDYIPPMIVPSQRLKKQFLSPMIYLVKNVEEALHPKLQEHCMQHPIFVISGLTTTLNINLDLFSSKTLAEVDPDLSIEIREQIKSTSDENWDLTQNKKVWKCLSIDSQRMTINEYRKYQAETLLKYYQSSGVLVSHNPDRIRPHKKTVKFATNVDLSNVQKWKPQLDELAKLPPFLRVECADNMLSHVGHNILGMNTVQSYMKV